MNRVFDWLFSLVCSSRPWRDGEKCSAWEHNKEMPRRCVYLLPPCCFFLFLFVNFFHHPVFFTFRFHLGVWMSKFEFLLVFCHWPHHWWWGEYGYLAYCLHRIWLVRACLEVISGIRSIIWGLPFLRMCHLDFCSCDDSHLFRSSCSAFRCWLHCSLYTLSEPACYAGYYLVDIPFVATATD